MPRQSNHENFLHQFHTKIQGEILSSFVVPLLCSDSSDDDSDGEEERCYSIAAKVAAYAAMEDSRYIFRTLTYRPDVQHAGSFWDDEPR
jgi:hypothetical protein